MIKVIIYGCCKNNSFLSTLKNNNKNKNKQQQKNNKNKTKQKTNKQTSKSAICEVLESLRIDVNPSKHPLEKMI